MQDFTLPANIKQIGSIGDGLRIYMEDYVCTFLHQYAESAGFEERIAFLVGKQMVIDGQQYLFIGGAIYGRYAEKHEGHLRFTEKSVDYAEEMLEEHFPNMEIVGWMQSQPSYGTYLNQYYGAYHLRQFRKEHQVMFVVDPLERTNAFYSANPVALTPGDRMAEIPGYFIYYEKNTNMHEYMLVNKSHNYTTKPPTLVEFKPVEYAGENVSANEEEDRQEEREDELEGRFSMAGPHSKRPEEVIRRHENAKARRRGTIVEQRRATNLLAGLCAVLFVISFVMGINLVRSQDRIDNNEAQIRQLTTALRNHMAMETTRTTNAYTHTPVFAESETYTHVQIGEAAGVVVAELSPQPAYNSYVTAPASPVTEETIPAAASTPPSAYEETALIPPIPETYTIQPGDSLLAISIYFFGDGNMVNEILTLNGIENPDHIVAGRTISLPPRR
ncbi:MAG: LysM peptidoglycan-binding domain-containing protein [Defluviitaleaceae bacterium]|nr:LysM peptidoglycan-binding domain-containing protein [Defluviitaleaceae bacterium]